MSHAACCVKHTAPSFFLFVNINPVPVTGRSTAVRCFVSWCHVPCVPFVVAVGFSRFHPCII